MFIQSEGCDSSAEEFTIAAYWFCDLEFIKNISRGQDFKYSTSIEFSGHPIESCVRAGSGQERRVLGYVVGKEEQQQEKNTYV